MRNCFQKKLLRRGCEETAASIAALQTVLLRAGETEDAEQVGIAFEHFKPVLVKHCPVNKTPKFS